MHPSTSPNCPHCPTSADRHQARARIAILLRYTWISFISIWNTMPRAAKHNQEIRPVKQAREGKTAKDRGEAQAERHRRATGAEHKKERRTGSCAKANQSPRGRRAHVPLLEPLHETGTGFSHQEMQNRHRSAATRHAAGARAALPEQLHDQQETQARLDHIIGETERGRNSL